MDCKQYAEIVREWKEEEMEEYERMLERQSVHELDNWEESVKLFQRQVLFSKKKFSGGYSVTKFRDCRIRANLWSGQRKRQGSEQC